VYTLNRKQFPGSKLLPVVGNGKVSRPKFMFVFINPTKRNASSHPRWQGPRFPFVGTKNVWDVFHRAGLFDDKLMYRIKYDTSWSLEFTRSVLWFLKRNSFYFTNIVKYTGEDATLPTSKMVQTYLPILEREIELVQPQYIVAFGQIPFTHLTKRKIKLDDYYHQCKKTEKLTLYDCQISANNIHVIPCYFPVGRGNPARAVEILSALKHL
jgi:DNA polymerase